MNMSLLIRMPSWVQTSTFLPIIAGVFVHAVVGMTVIVLAVFSVLALTRLYDAQPERVSTIRIVSKCFALFIAIPQHIQIVFDHGSIRCLGRLLQVSG
jgi:cation transport ATPase